MGPSMILVLSLALQRRKLARFQKDSDGGGHLIPVGGAVKVLDHLFGELAALINLTNEHPRSKETGVQVTLVAGVGFEPTTFRL